MPILAQYNSILKHNPISYWARLAQLKLIYPKQPLKFNSDQEAKDF